MAEGRVIRIVSDANVEPSEFPGAFPLDQPHPQLDLPHEESHQPVFYWQGYLNGEVIFSSIRVFEDRASAKENAEEIFCDCESGWIIDNEDL